MGLLHCLFLKKSHSLLCINFPIILLKTEMDEVKTQPLKTTNINSFTIDRKEIKIQKKSRTKLDQYFYNTAKRVQEEGFTGNTETPNVDVQSYLT